MPAGLKRAGLPLLALWVAALVFIYPLPHTIALRNLLLAGALVALLAGVVRAPGIWTTLRTRLGGERRSGALMLALLIWMIVASACFGFMPSQSLRQMAGDWGIALLAAAIAVLAVVRSERDPRVGNPRWLLAAAMLALFAHLAWLLGYQLVSALQSGQTALGATPFAQRDYHSGLAVLLWALALADGVARASARLPLTPLPTWGIGLMLGVAAVATGTLLTRNGTLVTLMLIVLALIAMLHVTLKSFSRRHWLAALLTSVLIATIGGFSFVKDPRWAGFFATYEIAADTTTHRAWLNSSRYPYPKLANGSFVEYSAYDRIAWAHVAVEQIGKYPLGVGYGHQAFGRAVARAYDPQTGIESSHSGLLDFTLANGIPGGVLWTLLCASLVLSGWRRFARDGDGAGLALALLVAGYYARCVLDGHLSGFRLEMNFFIAGLLLAAAKKDGEPVRCG